jgi:hypothetical protein
MKRTLSLVLALVLSVSVLFAQGGKNTQVLPKADKSTILGSSKASIIYYEDFAGEVPADWVIVTNEGPVTWEWTNTGGAYGGQLNSLTKANGYMIADSDEYGDESDEDTDLISPAIDCSAVAAGEPIYLYLEHMARTYGYAEIFITVSTDDFATETEIYSWGDGASQNAFNTSVNPLKSIFDITDIAHGESNVKIKFKWTGAWDYWWVLDDVMVYSGTPDEALMLTFEIEETPDAVIEMEGNLINVTVAYGTDITALTPTMTISEGASTNYAYPTALDFTTPKYITVYSEDGTSYNTYKITVEVETVYDVTFNVNMQYATGFDPASDVVYITGDLLGWAAPGADAANQTMTRVAETMVWTKTLKLKEGTYAYKFFINAGWDGGEWPGDPNRSVEVTGDVTVASTFGWKTSTPVSLLENLVAYPNPFKNEIFVSNAENVNRVVITNLIGQVVLDMPLNGTHKINTSNLNSGVYLVTFQTNNGERVVRKMIKQ